jgi:hypothetical protein
MPSLQTQDFWRVNSYGYPNHFSTETKAQEAWDTFSSFFDRHDSSYTDLKGFWATNRAPRRLDSHAVESWKATFEELGLLYVITRSDRITVTPAGFQFHDAATRNAQEDFIWIGLNLLFRYPLKGPARARRRNATHTNSNLLPYRFLYSAMRDLGDFFWWPELERIFCRVFDTTEAKDAVNAVREVRADPSRLRNYPVPVANKKGAFYNSLNQVVNHAGMNHLVLLQNDDSEQYGARESRRRHSIDRRFLSLVSSALGDIPTPDGCRTGALYVDRLPTAPNHNDEQEYFDYLGAEVPTLAEVAGAAAPRAVLLAGDTVFILKAGEHFREMAAIGTQKTIEGRASGLCFLARHHRVILSTDLAWTYLVIGKNLAGADVVQIVLRRARPIISVEPFQHLLGEDDA